MAVVADQLRRLQSNAISSVALYGVFETLSTLDLSDNFLNILDTTVISPSIQSPNVSVDVSGNPIGFVSSSALGNGSVDFEFMFVVDMIS